MIIALPSAASLAADRSSGKMLLTRSTVPVARIIPVTVGRMPPNAAFTSLLLLYRLKTFATISITINAGRTVPKVARAAPSASPILLPTNVARFTEIGPGVDSLTAMNSRSVSSSIQP